MLESGSKLSTGSRERVGVFGHAKQEGGYEKLANQGITQEKADAIILTTEEQKFYDAIQKFNESSYPAVKKYAMDTYNVDVGKVDNYMSYMTDYEAMGDLEMYDRFGKQAEDMITNRRTKKVEESFTKARIGAGTQKVQLDALKIAQRHADDVAYMLTMGKDIKQYSEIVYSPEIREKLGDVGALAWLQYLDLMARKGGSEGAKRLAALDVLRRNIGAGVLSFRLSSALVQFTSFADTMGTIGVEYATKGASRIATSKEWRQFVLNNFPEVRKAIGDDIAFREFGDGFMGKFSKVGTKPLQVLDGLMRSTAVTGAYEKLAFERGITVDLLNPDKQLIQEATALMRQSQGSSFFKDQPLALTTGFGLLENKSLNKAALTFQSFMLNRWDNMNRQIWRMGIKEGDYKKASASFFWMVIFAAATEEGIRRGGRSIINLATGDKQSEQSFAENSVLNVVQTIPIAGSLVSALTYSSNPVPIINTAEDLLTGAGTVVKGKAGSTKAKGAVQAIGAAGSLLGVAGSSQAAQIIKKIIPTSTGGTKSSGSKRLKTPAGLPSLPKFQLPTPPGLPKLPKL
ncbi:MAG TPA: hypothetical protein DCR71_01340 [Dehalococcoidia bacterium]|nr:hypothetical protein [Dehalococcoidia bacterium]